MSTFRKGDKVMIHGSVAHDHDGAFILLHIDLQGGGKIVANPDFVTLVSPRLVPGDLVEVRLATRIAAAEVLCVSETHGVAWLDLGDEGTAQQPLASLTRLERPQDIADAA
jgi:hypothetical protein